MQRQTMAHDQGTPAQQPTSMDSQNSERGGRTDCQVNQGEVDHLLIIFRSKITPSVFVGLIKVMFQNVHVASSLFGVKHQNLRNLFSLV
jgi:hypothetical protein